MTMTHYRVQDDEVVAASSPEELVTYLARTSYVPVDEQGFRERAAFWLENLWGHKIRTRTDAEFVEDMLAAGAYSIETIQ